jgi:hypothetical protein
LRREHFLKKLVRISSCQQQETRMTDLTAQITLKERQRIAGAIKEAAAMIQACPDPQKQWRAMHELRKLQAMLGSPSL